uniref:Uncharacterized protein n=1 Tax=Balaenoptera musculus TaxID=9771 RepID=A0A8C0CFA7_BALMU
MTAKAEERSQGGRERPSPASFPVPPPAKPLPVQRPELGVPLSVACLRRWPGVVWGAAPTLPSCGAQEIAELEANLPCTCKMHFPQPNKLHCFQLTVTPGFFGEMLDQDLAPQHHRDRRSMSEFIERTFD